MLYYGSRRRRVGEEIPYPDWFDEFEHGGRHTGRIVKYTSRPDEEFKTAEDLKAEGIELQLPQY